MYMLMYIYVIIYVYVNVIVYVFVTVNKVNTTYFSYFINYFFKDYYIVFLLLKKNERGLWGKQQFASFTQSQHIFQVFSHFPTIYCKNICFFQNDFVNLH